MKSNFGVWRLASGVSGLVLASACASRQPAVPPQPMPDSAAAMPAAQPQQPPAYDMAQRPALGPAPTVSLPPVVRRTLANGLEVMIVEHHELPVADFVLLMGTGSEADPARHAGLATLTANLLSEGAGRRTSVQVADQAAFLGVELDAGAGWDQSSVSLHTPIAQLDSALALMADVALRPTFPQREFNRIRAERATGLVQLRDQGPAIADRAFPGIVFGATHPYGRPQGGTEASTRAITRSDVQRFYRTYYRPNNATLIVVGDVRPDDVMARAERLFGGWQRATVPQVRYPQPPASGKTTVYLVDKPGAAQSSFRLGLVGVPRSTDDYFALAVMNTVLGGTFTSRLNNNLRETKGFTYGANSGFSMRRSAGPFTARAEIVTAKTDSALVEFMKELNAIRDTVPASELEKAKRFLQLQLPGSFETTRDIAGQLVPVVLYGLPADYYDTYVQRIDAVTQADVRRVAERYVNPSSMAVVIVGDRKVVEPGIRALNLAPVELREISGVLKD